MQKQILLKCKLLGKSHKHRYWLYPSIWSVRPVDRLGRLLWRWSLWRFINSTSTFTVYYSLMTVVDTWMRIFNFRKCIFSKKVLKPHWDESNPPRDEFWSIWTLIVFYFKNYEWINSVYLTKGLAKYTYCIYPYFIKYLFQ